MYTFRYAKARVSITTGQWYGYRKPTNGTGIDMQLSDGPVHAYVATGNCGDSSTAFYVTLTESDDNTTFTNLATRVKITQLTAAGDVMLETRVRNFSKRYAGLLLTPATAAVVCGATFIGQKKTV